MEQDKPKTPACRSCGHSTYPNPDPHVFKCINCGDYTDVRERLPEYPEAKRSKT